MASSSESSDLFDSAFDELVQKLDALYTGRLSFNRNPKDTDVYSYLSRVTNALKFWKYLKKLLICTQKFSNADKVVHNWDSCFIKIEAAFDKVAENIKFVCRKKTIAKRPVEAFNVLDVSEKEIRGVFKVEIGEALEHLSSSGSLEWKWNCCPFPAVISRCCELLDCIKPILGCIRKECSENSRISVAVDQARKVSEFLIKVTSLLDFLKYKPGQVLVQSVDDDKMNNFLNHLASLAVRTANQSFVYWINESVESNVKIVALLELQHEIDPGSPQFLGLIFKFLKILHKISPDNLVSSFAQYIIHPSWSRYSGLQINLETLTLFVINESEETPSHSLVEEITFIFTLLVRHTRGFRHHSVFELCARICLLNAEVLLKQELNCSKAISLWNQVRELNKLLACLRKFSNRSQQKNTGNGKQTLMFLNELASEIASLYQSSNEKKITEQTLRISLFKLLLKSVFFKAEFSCMELLKFLDSNDSAMGIGKDAVETFIEGLNLFKAFVTHQQDEGTTKDVELIFTHIEASTRGIITISYSLEIEKITEDMIKKLIISFSGLLDKMTVVIRNTEARELSPTFSFPKIARMSFIDVLLENIRELLKHSPDSVALMKHHIERILLDLEISRSFLVQPDTELLELEDLATHFTDVAYEAEYVIDSIEVGNSDNWQHLLWLHDVIKKIRLVNMQATNICREKSCDTKGHNVAQISSQMISPSSSKADVGELAICISGDEEILIDRLTRGSSQRDIVPIVGMPGIGKTTLAKKIYKDPQVTFHFHVRAWCSVSQVYAKRELLLDILCDIASELAEDIHQMTDEDLELQLYKCLKQKRYLIVLDDVWDTGAWNALETSFPNDGNGSRILMTSRLRDVSLMAKPDSEPHNLRLLSDDESWKLLQMKIFHGSCPEELLEVGKQIAKACKGLPLAIVAIAGLLDRTEKRQHVWKRISESLANQIIDDPQTRCMDILQLSYNHLPDYLKACFLYFGAFLGDKDVPVCKLIRLWIAEGFIQKTMQKSLEDLAEDYLVDLVGRSLVTASKIGSVGRIKACCIHDLLRELCLSKAKEENFLQLITGSDEPYASFSDLDFGTDYIDYYPLNPVKYEKYRVCICLNRKHFVKSRPSGPFTRSLIFFATSDQYPRRPYDISFLPDSFKILRVLDLENINMGTSFPTGIELLVHLRYLAVSGDIDFIPPSIANLRKLETLVVKGLRGKVLLPYSIWSMSRLRHIHVNDHVDFNLQDDKLGDSLLLENLVSFCSPLLTYGKDSEKIIRRFPNLRKLRCIFLESWNPSGNYNQFPELHFLTQLESLKIFYFGRFLNPGDFSLPKNLKKLTLSNFRLPWTHISAVGRLQNLEVLKLLSRAFEGPSWDMTEGEFLKLKYLKLDTLNIAQWNASSDHLPNLQQLVLRNCEALEEVPYTLGEISTLVKIEVQSCGRSSEESVRNIMEQEIEGLEIIINQKIHI